MLIVSNIGGSVEADKFMAADLPVGKKDRQKEQQVEPQ